MSNIIEEEEVQIGESLVDPTIHLGDLPDADDYPEDGSNVKISISAQSSGTITCPVLNFEDEIKAPVKRSKIPEEEEEIQIGESLVDPTLHLDHLSDIPGNNEDDVTIHATVLSPALSISNSKSKENAEKELVVEEELPSTQHPVTVCATAFEKSAKELGLKNIQSSEMKRQNAVRISSTSENSNGSVIPVINVQASDRTSNVDSNEKTQESLETLNPKANKPLKVSSGRKHSKEKQYEQVLSNYDIIDRTEAKNIEPVPEPFTFARVFNKIRRTLAVPQEGDKNHGDSDNHPFVQSNTIVNLSIQQTNDGEQMQVITVGRNKPKEQMNSKGMVVVVNELNKDDFGLDSDAESVSSDSDEEDDYGLDSPDSIQKQSYDLTSRDKQDDVQVKEKYRLKSESDVIDKSKHTNISRGIISKSFGPADRDPSKAMQRRVTVGGAEMKMLVDKGSGIFPFQAGDSGTLPNKKTLPSEPFILITDGYPTIVPSFPSDRRSLIALEIYTTERTFVRGMEIIVKHFKRRIELGNFLDAKELKLVFANIDKILEGNRSLLDDMFDRISDWSDEQCIGDLFLRYEDHFKIYSDYAKNYDTSEALIKTKLKKKKDLETLLTACYTNPVCMPGLTLPSYLITVIQRIPRYILLLRDLIKRTSNTHPDYEDLEKSQEMMEKVAKFLNEQLKQAQCAKALEALHTQIVGLKAYYTPDRTLVHEGDVCLLTCKKTYQCVLFNDLLVFAVKGGVRQSAVELTLEIKSVWIEDLEDLDPQTTKKDAIGIYTPDRPYTMYVGNNGEKKLWIQHLKQAIRENLKAENGVDELDLDTRETNYTYKDESMYSGHFYKAKRHGQGTRMWPNQMTYNGNWQDDERNGHGVLEYFTGDVYEGHWVDDKQEGKGVYKCKSGDKIIGQWKDGLKHGPIEILYQNGDHFKGQFRNDCIDGKGEFKCKNGFHYNGEWKMNLKHGQGTLTTSDGLEYTGNFLYDRFHGYGELRYGDGSIYKGEFEQGQRYGKGAYTVPGGLSYEGQWTSDLKDGRGKMVYENGDVYDGIWMHDMRIGQGVVTYNYGGYYRGQWQAGLRHGSGIFEMKDGSVYDGEFFNDQMNGSGQIKYRNGSMYTGYWQDNLPNGKGILTKPGGYTCDGNWVLGKQNGYCTLSDPANKYQYKGEWLNGVKEGRGKETIGDVIYEGGFAENLRNGGGTETHLNGSVFEGKWSRGQKDGRGIKKKTIGVVEHQIWNHGCLIKTNLVLPPAELPVISRGL